MERRKQATLSTVVQGIYVALDENCDIINMSFGTDVDSDILHNAIREAERKGVLMIGAAGNHVGSVEYPAAYDEVMAVGATDRSGQKIADYDPNEEIVAGTEYLLLNGFKTYAVSTKGGNISNTLSKSWGKCSTSEEY